MADLRTIVSQPWSSRRVGDELLAAFTGPFDTVYASVGFANASGVRHIAAALTDLRGRGATVQIVVGVDGQITSLTGVLALRRLVDQLWLFRHPGRPLFHPKTYLFEGQTTGLALTGSANLTESALWVNYEDVAVIEFDLSVANDQQLFSDLKSCHTSALGSGNAHLATDPAIAQIKAMGLLPSEAEQRRNRHNQGVGIDQRAARSSASSATPPLFPHSPAGRPPAVPLLAEEVQDAQRHAPPATHGAPPPPPIPPQNSRFTVFVLKLGPRDVSSQAGYSRDVFIPLAARRADPYFWGALTPMVTPDGHRYEQRYAVIEFRRRLGNVEQESRRLYYYERRSEFRLNTRQVSDDAASGDLLVVELAPPAIGVEYIATVVKPTDALFGAYDAIAVNLVPNSPKRWGYA